MTNKRVRVRKSLIINAIMNEPLMVNSFFETSASDPNCKVCAVGGVLRRAKLADKVYPSAACKGTYSANADLKYALEEKNYLGALSIKHESEAQKDLEREGLSMLSAEKWVPTLRHRKKLVRFVEKNFPDQVTVPADAFVPNRR